MESNAIQTVIIPTANPTKFYDIQEFDQIQLQESNQRVIILYFRSTLNAYFLLLQKLWISLIKFMMGPITSVKRVSTHLIYSRNI